ncbi:hypothetical protein NDU88_009020 [Pleurodeles waltl]|uniref:Uncharacterized protein n=1 Tax=Pleurodeles waltl TaxID=8319 RepID=A0AAV7NYA9_PLEWA|nr:hypothetical protein NDU88_009020 [Pleurodeles waltl]
MQDRLLMSLQEEAARGARSGLLFPQLGSHVGFCGDRVSRAGLGSRLSRPWGQRSLVSINELQRREGSRESSSSQLQDSRDLVDWKITEVNCSLGDLKVAAQNFTKEVLRDLRSVVEADLLDDVLLNSEMEYEVYMCIAAMLDLLYILTLYIINHFRSAISQKGVS